MIKKKSSTAYRITISVILIVLISFVIPATAQKKSSEEDKSGVSSKLVSGLKFRSIGPALMSGRIIDFAVNPDKPSEYYVAVASGGVWKTNNSGITWTPVFDKEKSFCIGCVSMDPSNHNVVWVGTGENSKCRWRPCVWQAQTAPSPAHRWRDTVARQLPRCRRSAM